MSSLWERLDVAFAAAFDGDMGIGGVYGDLRLREVAVNEVWDPDRAPWPRLILYSNTARLGVSEHGGGGEQRYDAAYPYLAVAVTDGESYGETRARAQMLFSRMLHVLKRPAAILQAAMAADPTGTERAVRVVPERGGASGIQVTGGPRQWRGVAILGWAVETKV